MGLSYDACAYYGWDEMLSCDILDNLFQYTYFYRNNINKYNSIEDCYSDFIEDDEACDFFSYTNLYDCECIAPGIGVDFNGSMKHVTESMEEAIEEYWDFIECCFFDKTKLPEPKFHVVGILY